MHIDLTGKHAVVTGSSKGIGRAIALQLARSGAHVTLVARDAEKLKKVIDELPGRQHQCIPADFSKPEEALETLNIIKEKPVDILVNNTGGPAPGPIESAEWQHFEKALGMHLHMSHELTKMVLPGMKASKYGRIINVISTSVKIPIPGLGVSNTVRGAMASWAKTFASEAGPFGITVNNILPGFVNTDRLSGLIEKKAEQGNTTIDAISQNMLGSIPAGRFGEPEELAYYACFLASDKAGYINGTSVQIDGGRTGAI